MRELLQDYPVVVEIPVAWGEMDSLNHVNKMYYFRYFEEARIAYFETIKIIEQMRRTGIGPILRSTSCTYKHPLTYPDTVSAGAKITDVQQDRFTMHYTVVSHRHQTVAAEGNGVIVMFNYREGKKAELPDEVRKLISETERS